MYFIYFADMYTPTRFKILRELQELKSLLKNLTSDNTISSTNHLREETKNSENMLLLLNLFQFSIMIGLVIAFMCNFFLVKKPGWQDIAFKAIAFGIIVTFWPIYLFILLLMSCYSKCFKEEKEKVKNFKGRYMCASGPTLKLIEENFTVRLDFE